MLPDNHILNSKVLMSISVKIGRFLPFTQNYDKWKESLFEITDSLKKSLEVFSTTACGQLTICFTCFSYSTLATSRRTSFTNINDTAKKFYHRLPRLFFVDVLSSSSPIHLIICRYYCFTCHFSRIKSRSLSLITVGTIIIIIYVLILLM